MVVKEFSALNFRNYRELNIAFSGGINLVTGGNGQGKTNLAEGIHFLCHLSSFRTGRLDEVIAFGEPGADIQGIVAKGDFSQKARVQITRRGRRVWLEGEPVPRLSSYVSMFYALLFNPDSLYSYRQYPAARRRLYDRFLSFVDRVYVDALREFRTVQAQKNGLLKRNEQSSLPEWNRLFIEKARVIIKKRRDLVARLNGNLANLYARLTGGEAGLRLEYRPSLAGEPERDATALARAAGHEAQAGHALLGPHRDDYRLVSGEGRPEGFFSQGEYRTSLLAVTLALNESLMDDAGLRPVIILDDLYSELDRPLRARLSAFLQDMPNQIFITTTEPPEALPLPGAQVMEVRAGRIV